MKRFLLLLLLASELVCFAQSDVAKINYEPSDKESLVNLLEELYENQIDGISNNNKKQVKKIYKNRHEGIVEMLNDSVFIFSEKQSNYLTSILRHIYQSNPEIDSKDFTFLLNRSPVPNAACFGDKTFMVNLGLINLLENEDQYAFILCHELAHYQLNHVNKSINDRIDILNSRAVLKEAKEIKKKEYGRNKEGLTFLKGLTFDFLKYSREVEIEADSLGLLLFKNTKYSEFESKQSLKLLGKLDDIIFQDSILLKEVFNFKNYPFKDYWIEDESSLFTIDEKVDDYGWDKDSLKTHPDIKLRMNALTKLGLKNNDVAVSEFQSFKILAKKQQLNSLIENHQLDMALYLSLSEIQNQSSESSFYNTKIAQIFIDMYELRKTHKLGKYIPAVSPITKEKNINKVRQFIHNLELKNMRKIGYYFCLDKQELIESTDEFKEIFSQLKIINKL